MVLEDTTEDPGWLLVIPHHLFFLVLNSSAFSHLPLRFHGSGSWALWKLLLRDCLQPQTLPAQFQGKGKAIPCLGRSESVSVSSASWCPQITPRPHPIHSPISPCCSVIREWESISLEVKWGCALHAPSPYYPPWCHSLLFPGTCNLPPWHETPYFMQE